MRCPSRIIGGHFTPRSKTEAKIAKYAEMGDEEKLKKHQQKLDIKNHGALRSGGELVFCSALLIGELVLRGIAMCPP